MGRGGATRMPRRDRPHPRGTCFAPVCNMGSAQHAKRDLESSYPRTLPSCEAPRSGSRMRCSTPSERPDLAPGDLVAHRYRLERKLGRGGMGEVWAAVHTTIRSRVALKVLLPHAKCFP